MMKFLNIAILFGFPILVRTVAGDVCESAHIPLRTLHSGDSTICVVPFCGTEAPHQNEDGYDTCLTCDNSPWAGTAESFVAKSDVCPIALGECQNGHCCPLTGEDTWYHQNFGVDWKGMNTFPHITVTTYGGSTACGGTVEDATKYVQQFGIDAIAAVPSQMYGSWSRASQQCYRNNNICYRVKAHDDSEYLIAIWGKCGGYTQCPGRGPGMENYFSEIATVYDDAGWWDANQCINQKGVQIACGTTPDCISLNGGNGTDPEGKNCCPHLCQRHVDWCGSNDHLNLDISASLYEVICPDLNPCTVKWAKAELCTWNPPVDPEAGNWTPKLSEALAPGDPGVASIHSPYPEPSCGGPSPSTSSTSSTSTSSTSSSMSPSTPTPSNVPNCNDVLSADVPGLPSSCAPSVCSAVCKLFMTDKGCGSSDDPINCVEEGVKETLCMESDPSCQCTFGTEPSHFDCSVEAADWVGMSGGCSTSFCKALCETFAEECGLVRTCVEDKVKNVCGSSSCCTYA